MYFEIKKGVTYKNRIPKALVLSGYWVFSKSSFNEGNDSRFTYGRLSLITLVISFIAKFKFYQ